MIYLDYSATTPVDEEVLDAFVKTTKEYIGNANSLHLLGVKSKKLMESATMQVASLLNVDKEEVIFTSGASESNSLAILGLLLKYPHRGKHILTTSLEHSSITETLKYCEKLGYVIDIIPLLENGAIDFEKMKKMITKDTILVTIAQVSSELGISQDVEKIGAYLKDYPLTFFHVDGTQAVGKIPIHLENIDLFTFSGHKIYGLKGVGCLIKKKKIELEPLIHGGKSQTIYRSGTPALPLMVSLAKALRLSLSTQKEHYLKVKKLNEILIEGLKEIPMVTINSTSLSIPHIVNFSVPTIKAETLLHQLEQEEIYVSTKTACSSEKDLSLALLALAKDKEVARSSIRVSLSHLTTEEEVKTFLKILKESIEKLHLK